MNLDVINPPAASGEPVFQALLKSCASDFCVSENLSIDFAESGEHLYFLIEKSSMNTDEVLALLERSFAVKSSDIGCCGLKDRHALTTQWFSIRTTDDVALFENTVRDFNQTQLIERADAEGYVKSLRILETHRHVRKLRRGAHDGNQFLIVLRQVKAVDNVTVGDMHTAVAERINTLTQHGFPNYIGPQRFGQGARNIQRAQQWFARPKKRCSRAQRSLWLSSARSVLFNVVCAARVREGSWQHLLEGEPAALNGSRSFFLDNSSQDSISDITPQDPVSDKTLQDSALDNTALDSVSDITPRDSVRDKTLPDSNSDWTPQDFESDNTLKARLAVFDIHPSAPWWGRGRTAAEGACAELESRLLAPYQDLREGLERAGLAQERRALRAQAEHLSHRWLADDVLELSFSLPPGVFATTLLREIGCVNEPQRQG